MWRSKFVSSEDKVEKTPMVEKDLEQESLTNRVNTSFNLNLYVAKKGQNGQQELILLYRSAPKQCHNLS